MSCEAVFCLDKLAAGLSDSPSASGIKMGFKITVVTATFNRAKFLPRCIESVAGQSYPDKEHIIIDGGSTDGTVDLLRGYSEMYPHIKWVSEKDNGISSALNKGLALATGDAVGVIGDDDFYLPGALSIVASEFQRDADVGLVAGGCEFITNNDSVWMTQKAGFTSRKDLIQCWRYWGNSVTLPAPSTFLRKRVIDIVGGFDESDRYSMDYRHWIKITNKFPKVKTVDAALAKFRCDEGSVSFSLNPQQQAETLSISREYWGNKWSLTYYEMLASYLRHYKWPKFAEQVKEFEKQVRETCRPRRIAHLLIREKLGWQKAHKQATTVGEKMDKETN